MSPNADPTAPKGLKEVVGNLLAGLGCLFLGALFTMLLFGVLHASAHVVPAFGYWQMFFTSFVVAWLVGCALIDLTARVKKLGLLLQIQNSVGALSSTLTNLLKSTKS